MESGIHYFAEHPRIDDLAPTRGMVGQTCFRIWSDIQIYFLIEQHEKTNQSINCKPLDPTAKQCGDFRLVDADLLRNFNL